MQKVILLLIAATLYGGAMFSTYNSSTIHPISIPSTNGYDFIIADSMLVSQDFTYAQCMNFFNQFEGNLFTQSERDAIYKTCRKWKINFLAFVVKIQLESSLISWCEGYSQRYENLKTWCLGAGMYYSLKTNGRIIKPYAGFLNQLEYGAKCLRENYNAWTNGMTVRINEGRNYVKPRNAATYALYRYTPYWGTWRENGATCSGNEYFIVVYTRFSTKWMEAVK